MKRTDVPNEKARKTRHAPKPILKPDKRNGLIVIDSETTLSGVPPEVWDYRLANRSALEWVLDQYKEKRQKDRTVRENFNTYRFSNYKEEVIVLLRKVITISVETMKVVRAMGASGKD